MSAQILLNLLNKLRKRDKMQGLSSILSLFCNKFNKFNNTGAQMLDPIYHMTLKLFKNHIFWCRNIKILPSCMQLYNGPHYVKFIFCKPLVIYRFYCMALHHYQRQYHVTKSTNVSNIQTVSKHLVPNFLFCSFMGIHFKYWNLGFLYMKYLIHRSSSLSRCLR